MSKRIMFAAKMTEEELKQIDKAAEVERRSRSSYLVKSGLDNAEKLLNKETNGA